MLHAGRPCQGTRVLLRSHILLAHALWRGRSLCSLGGVPCWGLLWACLLAGGWVSCLRAGRVRVGVCASWCWRFGVVVGQCGPAAPAPACLLACSRPGVGLLACAVVLRARWAEGGLVGAGHGCPAPYSVALPPLRCAWMRKRVGVPARSGEHNPTPSLVLAYMETGSHPVGAKQRGGATGRAGWPGWGRGAFLVRAP